MESGGLDTLATFDLLDRVDFDGYVPANGAIYPSTLFGKGLENTSALIKAELGTEAVMLEIPSWDLHENEAGKLASLLADLAGGMAAFHLDHRQNLDRVLMVVLSEFGRRVAENASHGTDQGHGNSMLVMGGHVAGGRVLTQWPGLASSQLDAGDLAITIDYRDILAETLAKRLESTRLDQVFPNHTRHDRGIIV